MTDQPEPARAAALHPADVYRARPLPTSSESSDRDEIVVRRDPRRLLLTTLLASAAATLVLCWLPAIIVLLRAEPGYFTLGALLTAMFASIAIVTVAVGVAWLWTRRASFRRPIVLIDDEGLRWPDGDAEQRLEWERIGRVRLVGRRVPTLVVHERPPVADEPPELVEPELHEPQYLPPLDFVNDPPPPTVQPEQSAFDEISPVPAEPEPETDTPDPQPEQPIGSRELFHGTPHAIALRDVAGGPHQVLRAVADFADGRVRIG